jgi:hypothetical protein
MLQRRMSTGAESFKLEETKEPARIDNELSMIQYSHRRPSTKYIFRQRDFSYFRMGPQDSLQYISFGEDCGVSNPRPSCTEFGKRHLLASVIFLGGRDQKVFRQ